MVAQPVRRWKRGHAVVLSSVELPPFGRLEIFGARTDSSRFGLLRLVRDAVEELLHRDAEAGRELGDRSHSGVALGALDAADVRHVKLGQFGQTLLGDTATLALGTKIGGKALQSVHEG